MIRRYRSRRASRLFSTVSARAISSTEERSTGFIPIDSPRSGAVTEARSGSSWMKSENRKATNATGAA